MTRTTLLKIAASSLVLALTTGGCSALNFGKSANSASDVDVDVASAPVKPAGNAAEAAADSREAMEKGKLGKAISYAESAVAGAPQDPAYRLLLAQTYLNAGRFQSAETAFADAMTLGAVDAKSVIGLALSKIALAKPADAVRVIDEHREIIPASDYGLALAMAGDLERALYVLNDAARGDDSTARTRQNLAFAYAMSGRWAQSRIIASQDMSPASLDGRMAEWAAMAQQPQPELRVAALMGVKAHKDSGMPVRLALNSNSGPALAAVADDALALASSDPAPVAEFAPPPPVATLASVTPAVETPLIRADLEPYRAAPEPVPAPVAKAAPVAKVAPVRTAAAPAKAKPVVAAVPAKSAAPVVFDAKKPAGWAVQLGAYDSLAIAKDAWARIAARNPELGKFPASSHAVVVKGKTYYRLTANGVGTKSAASSLCSGASAKGQSCFVRQMDGSEKIQWASRATPVRLASR